MDLRTFGLTFKTFKTFILNKFLKQKAILKNFAISTGNTCVGAYF